MEEPSVMAQLASGALGTTVTRGWNAATNSAADSSQIAGITSQDLVRQEATIAPVDQALDYYLRLTSASGTNLLGGSSPWVQISGADLELLIDGGLSSDGTWTAGRVTFDPLHLLLAGSTLDPVLLQDLGMGTGLEMEIAAYTKGQTAHLQDDYRFGTVKVSGVQTTGHGEVPVQSYSFSYGQEVIEHYTTSAQGNTTLTGTQGWDAVKRVAISTTGPVQAALPGSAPVANTSIQAGGDEDYLRFSDASGNLNNLDSGSLYSVDGFDFGAAEAAGGPLTFGTLNFSLGSSNLALQLDQMLATGKSLDAIELFSGRTTSQGQVFSVADAFKQVHIESDSIDPSTGAHAFTVEYASLVESVTPDELACYCRGTRILTDHGEVAVEELEIGDRLLTSAGVARPIKWIGRRSYPGRFANGNRDVLPICFSQGSLAGNVPHRDLWVSPRHAMFLDGVLIAAEHLVNGVSVVQATHVDLVEYFHVELDSHDVIVAEGSLSETFVDDNSRSMFLNADEFCALYGDAVSARTVYCAPRVEDGFVLETVRRRLAAQAGQLVDASPAQGPLLGFFERVSDGCANGWAQDTEYPDSPVCLDVLVDGLVVAQVLAERFRADLLQAGIGDGRHGFCVALPGWTIAREAITVRRTADGRTLPRLFQTMPAAATRMGMREAA